MADNLSEWTNVKAEYSSFCNGNNNDLEDLDSNFKVPADPIV